MIYKDEQGHRWLACDYCRAHDIENEFWGIGLGTNKLVRSAAASLEGFRRRKILLDVEPEIKYVWLDLCAECSSREGMGALYWDIAVARGLRKREACPEGPDSTLLDTRG